MFPTSGVSKKTRMHEPCKDVEKKSPAELWFQEHQ